MMDYANIIRVNITEMCLVDQSGCSVFVMTC